MEDGEGRRNPHHSRFDERPAVTFEAVSDLAAGFEIKLSS
jgi:hypothetical protein